MENQIIIWRLAVDLSLVTAILVMAFRWMKASRAQAMLPRTLELEASLRSLISEADAAGRHLNEQLLRREQNLQKLLIDVSEAEGRLSRAIASAEERTKEMQIGLDTARGVLSDLRGSSRGEVLAARHQQMGQQGREYSLNRSEGNPQFPQSRAPSRYQEQEPPTFEEAGYYRSQPQAETPPAHTRQAQARQITGQSEQRDERQAVRAPHAAPPRYSVEPNTLREPSQKGNGYQAEQPSGLSSMQKVYAAAEVLLKQGKELEQVSAQTRLPVEEVRMLSQMIEIEREEQQRSITSSSLTAQDSRLGVLGSIRRQTTTI